MAFAKSALRRALLYVPGYSKKMMMKSRGLDVDLVAYDLEDSVSSDFKHEARLAVRNLLHQPRVPSIREQAVRINSVDSGYALNDLTEVLKSPFLDTIIVPKVNSASDLHFVSDVIRHLLPDRSQHGVKASTSSVTSRPKPPISILALVESAKALSSLREICTSSPYLSGLVFAAEDFALDLSITRTPSLSEFLFARSAIVAACRTHDLSSAIDLVSTNYKGESAEQDLAKECLDGRNLGFNGKQCIHPSQIETTQKMFCPGIKEIEWAARVVIADAKAEKAGRAAWSLDGKMIDVPVVRKARATIATARLCGINIEELFEIWKGQETE